jgi:predicted membrane protein
MKNTTSRPVLGIIFILLGILLAAKVFGLFDYISFNGWWTFFIIIPCFLGLFQGNNFSGSFFGLGIGIILFLGMNQLISWRVAPQLIAGLVFAAIGLSFLFKDEKINKDNKQSKGEKEKWQAYEEQTKTYDNQWKAYQGGEQEENQKQQGDTKKQEGYTNQKQDGAGNNSYNYQNTNNGQGYYKTHGSGRHNQYNAVLNGRVIQIMEEEFTGCSITAILGNLQLDLRNAIIREDVVVDVTCLLGGLDIFVPANAKVSVSCTPILGGVENRVSLSGRGMQNTVTIYIRGTCVLGGIEIR